MDNKRCLEVYLFGLEVEVVTLNGGFEIKKHCKLRLVVLVLGHQNHQRNSLALK